MKYLCCEEKIFSIFKAVLTLDINNMNAIKQIRIDDIWTPPIRKGTPFIPSGNDVIDQFANQIRIRQVEPMNYYAKNLQLTVSALSKTVNTFTGMTASVFKSTIVLYDAQWYLLHTLLSVKEIAARMGYSQASSFNNFFKRAASISPTDYRKANRKVEKEVKYTIIYY